MLNTGPQNTLDNPNRQNISSLQSEYTWRKHPRYVPHILPLTGFLGSNNAHILLACFGRSDPCSGISGHSGTICSRISPHCFLQSEQNPLPSTKQRRIKKARMHLQLGQDINYVSKYPGNLHPSSVLACSQLFGHFGPLVQNANSRFLGHTTCQMQNWVQNWLKSMYLSTMSCPA